MTVKNSTDFFHEVHDPLERYFRKSIFSLHNLLWQFICNDVHNEEIVILHPVYHEGTLQLSMVFFKEAGHNPTHVTFKESVTHDKAMKIADKLNQQLFGIMPMLASTIVLISMRDGNIKPKRQIREEDCEFSNGNVYVKGELYGAESDFFQDHEEGKFEYKEKVSTQEEGV